MKKVVILVLVILILCLAVSCFLLADGKADLQAIKKTVKENPNYEQGKEVKWFKVLVTDTTTNKDRVRITLPVALIEVLVQCSHEKHLKFDDECDVDFKELFRELKKLGPMVIIEVYDEGEIIKVWFE